MIFYQENKKLSEKISLFIFFDRGSFGEDDDSVGYTHLAEHLIFGAAGEFSAEEMEAKRKRLFRRIAAVTNPERVGIFACFAEKDLKEALEILRLMIFDWRAEKSFFESEKRNILDEEQRYAQSVNYRQGEKNCRLLGIKKELLLGSVKHLKKISWNEVGKVRKYWDNLVKKATLNVLVSGRGMSDKQLSEIGARLGSADKLGRARVGDLKEIDLRGYGGLTLFSFKSKSYHPCSSVLDLVFRHRLQADGWSEYVYLFFEMKNVTGFSLYSEKEADWRKRKEFFRRPIKEAEFNLAKKAFLADFKKCQQATDEMKSMEALASFLGESYVGMLTDDLSSVYGYFAELDWKTFDGFTDKLMV